MRLLNEQSLRDIASGSAVLGTGGGGDPYLGTLVSLHALEQYGPMQLVTADELDDEAMVVFPFVIGSPVPLTEKFPLGKEMVQAYETINRFLHGRVQAVMPIEIGGINSMVPFFIAARLGIPVVDGDCMGRAYPEVQLVTLTMHGIGASPFAIADERGDSVVLHTIDNFWAERFARSISVDMGAICAGAAYPVTGKQVREAAVLGSISYTERIGRAIREANASKQDAIAAILEVTHGFVIFSGKIVDVQRRTSRGWALGECVLEGMNADAGTHLAVRFQNENLVAIRDGEIIASVPDLITIMDAESGQAITTEQLRYGFRVVVLGIPCDPKWRTPAGIELGGPRHFRYDIDYVPLEQRFAAAGRTDGRQASRV
jgi:uncharacterized protein